ncbi:hypothetical protein [Paracoccus bogoriensis]|uniref:hypothetical protein n=1 Tax=Paracoccus bogoriensis TaxID=242065 RepID=UPI001FE749EB|nr:hypothetical protein [Paracoccus bogoriensis]
MPQGLAALIAPERLLIAGTTQKTDTLAAAEQAPEGWQPAFRADPDHPSPESARGGRPQLAAQAGGTTDLCMTPQDTGSNAAQTLWHCAHVFSDRGSTLMLRELEESK